MPKPNIVGVILAGGTSQRMQSISNGDKNVDKSLLKLGGVTLLEQIIHKAKLQADTLLISSNSSEPALAGFNLPVLADLEKFHFAGPLAGVHAAMNWALQNTSSPEHTWVASFPVDCPFFPEDVVTQLQSAAFSQKKSMAHASYRGRVSPLFSLWSLDLYKDLTAQLEKSEQKVSLFLTRHASAEVDFDHYDADPFCNINTPEDLALAHGRLS